MAYLRPLRKKCFDCPKAASVELLNNRNGRMGDYCSTCGKRRLKEQVKWEKEQAATQYTQSSTQSRVVFESDRPDGGPRAESQQERFGIR